MLKHREQRIGVFVDVANMYHSAKNLYGAKVNFQEVLRTAIADRKLIRAIAYVIRSESEEERGFFGALDNQGFEVKAKDLQVFAGGAKKADWDVGIAMDCIKMASKLDSVILVSGDGDYVPLVTYLQENKGCQVEVLAFGKTTSARLIEAVDDFIDLGKDPKKFLIHGPVQNKSKLISNIKKLTQKR
ncbi:MAG: NYN domain-containing protein [Candidatus Buchananbacteria bacterium]|nr:NYN domain-containing protein [Candidatus Buchananbacteria bacterium]